MTAPLLQVEDLSVEFLSGKTVTRAVDGVGFVVEACGCVGIVGESGSGKSVTSLSILRLIATPPGRIASGRILFEGEDLLSLPADRMPEIRSRDIAMIFQEPMSSLNPVMTIGDQIAEAVMLHENRPRRECRARALEMLGLVGIPAPVERIDAFPHQFSGGMRQRVMIAMALACNPKLLIADEPTTALDVTIQAQVLELMKRIRRTLNTAVLIISHDLGVIAEIADRVVVMYAGKIVESADVRTIFQRPGHPYTRGLLKSIPRLRDDRRRLHQIPGSVPAPGTLIAGCPFAPRCPDRQAICTEKPPPLVDLGSGQTASCWVAGEGAR